MNILLLIAAFGGGVLGAAIGAVGIFAILGIVVVAGGAVGLAGGPDLFIGHLAFSAYLGPHVAFAGGVAAAAFAGNKRKTMANGADVATPVFSANDPAALAVGGVFGVIGFLLVHLFDVVIGIPTDNVALAVFTSAMVVRLVFGSGGPFGKYTPPADNPNAKREWFPKGGALGNCIVLGLGLGIVVSGIGLGLIEAGVPVALVQEFFPVTVFGVAAFSLFLALMGHGIPATHHIVLPAALAAVLSGNMIVGAVVGVVCSLIGDIAGRAWNAHGNTFIDPPATTIFSTTFVILAIWG